jgi:Flp pilus assembly protein TadG
MVELALVLPLLLVLLLGMLDFGKGVHYWIDATHLANEGARFAMVNKNPSATGTLQAYIQQQATAAETRNGGTAQVPTAGQVCIDFPLGGAQIGDPVRVTYTVTYNWLPFIAGRIGGVGGTTITGQATMRLEALPTNYAAGCS